MSTNKRTASRKSAKAIKNKDGGDDDDDGNDDDDEEVVCVRRSKRQKIEPKKTEKATTTTTTTAVKIERKEKEVSTKARSVKTETKAKKEPLDAPPALEADVPAPAPALPTKSEIKVKTEAPAAASAAAAASVVNHTAHTTEKTGSVKAESHTDRPAAAAAAAAAAASSAVVKTEKKERQMVQPPPRPTSSSAAGVVAQLSAAVAAVAARVPIPFKIEKKEDTDIPHVPAAAAAAAPAAAPAAVQRLSRVADRFTLAMEECRSIKDASCTRKVFTLTDEGEIKIHADNPIYVERAENGRINIRSMFAHGGSSVTISGNGVTVSGNGVTISSGNGISMLGNMFGFGSLNAGSMVNVINGRVVGVNSANPVVENDARLSRIWYIRLSSWTLCPIQEINLSGAAVIEMDRMLISRAELYATLSGSGSFRLTTRTEDETMELDVTMSGMGSLNFGGNRFRRVKCHLSGMGDISNFHATSRLRVNLSGMGNIRGTYARNACSVDKNVRGMGDCSLTPI